MKLLSLLLIILVIFSCSDVQKKLSDGNLQEEKINIEKTINNVIGWAVNKDFDLFFSSISNDSNFVSVTPYDRVKFGFKDVLNDTSFWASPNFKAIRHEIHDLKINISNDWEVAWFYCRLDDINTWKGNPANWENIRWTGVLEKRNGAWRVVQQHFSWPKL
jgi:ketosteroid isomerase-like protein